MYGNQSIGGYVPGMNMLQKYGVNLNQVEAIRATLYDSAQYVAAGQSSLAFFSTPAGQGTSWSGTGTKNFSDTNMVLAGQLPAMQWFLIQSIEVQFYPASPTVAAGMPSATGAVAVNTSINDTYIFRRSGNLILTIGSKPYITDAPMGKFPGRQWFEVEGAASDTTTAGAAQQTRHTAAFMAGVPYMLSPSPLMLTSSQNFNVTLAWPEGLQTITNPARTFVMLNGYLYRASQ